MIFRLLFNKYTLLAVIAFFGDKSANKYYTDNTTTEEEEARIKTPNHSLTTKERDKEANQKTIIYKCIAWYQGKKASWFEAAVEKLKPLRDKLTTIR